MNPFNKYVNEVRISLEPTDNQRTQIIERVNRIRDLIETDNYFEGSDFLNKKSYLQGSWLRNTMIRKPSDILWDVDILAIRGKCAPSSAPVPGNPLPQPNSILQTLKTHLDNTPPFNSMGVKQDFPCIIIEYASDKFNLEIMPVWHGNPNYYPSSPQRLFLIPDTNINWKWSFPFEFDEKISSLNQDFDGSVKWTIKMIKHWNNLNDNLLSGYLIENLTYNLFINSPELKGFVLITCISNWFDYAGEWINNRDYNCSFQPTISDGYGSKLDQTYIHQSNKWEKLKNNIQKAKSLLGSGDLDDLKELFPKI